MLISFGCFISRQNYCTSCGCRFPPNKSVMTKMAQFCSELGATHSDSWILLDKKQKSVVDRNHKHVFHLRSNLLKPTSDMMSKLIAIANHSRRTIPKVSCPSKSTLAWSGSDSLFIERSLPINPSMFPRPQHNFDNILKSMARTPRARRLSTKSLKYVYCKTRAHPTWL